MALNSAELRVLARIISSRHSPHLLFLGYPDLLTDEATWPLESITWRDAPKRKNAGSVWAGHGRAHLKNYPMVETKGLFQSLGCDVTVADAISWGGEDVVMDLNLPAPENMCGRFDIIIDPGTLEHCFNIAQAFDNIDRMLRVGGVVYHQNAIAFPNHGLWSISPTAYFDFYQPRDYLLGTPRKFGKVLDANGHDVMLEPIDPFEPITAPLSTAIGSYWFQKTKHQSGAVSYPVQRYYSSRYSLNIPLVDFVDSKLSWRVLVAHHLSDIFYRIKFYWARKLSRTRLA